MPNYSNRNKLDELNEQAKGLITEISKLNEETGNQISGVSKRLTRNQKIMWLLVATLLLTVITTVVLAFTVASTRENTEKVDAITTRLDIQQTVTRQKVLCPLYQIFVDSRSEQARKTYPRGPEEYDRIFNIIQTSYDTIKCGEFKQEKGEGLKP